LAPGQPIERRDPDFVLAIGFLDLGAEQVARKVMVAAESK